VCVCQLFIVIFFFHCCVDKASISEVINACNDYKVSVLKLWEYNILWCNNTLCLTQYIGGDNGEIYVFFFHSYFAKPTFEEKNCISFWSPLIAKCMSLHRRLELLNFGHSSVMCLMVSSLSQNSQSSFVMRCNCIRRKSESL